MYCHHRHATNQAIKASRPSAHRHATNQVYVCHQGKQAGMPIATLTGCGVAGTVCVVAGTGH